jgi:hypothetical protein
MAVLTRIARWLAGAFIAFAIGSSRGAEPAAAAGSAAGEYQVKAVFLYNFAQFVEWPARAFAARNSPLVIGVLGEDPFGSYLDELVKGETVAGRPIVVRRYREPAEIGECHILFVSDSESGRMPQIVAALQARSILTVSDAENFTRAGGMVRFVTESGKLRMRINHEAARESGLIISSKILRPATIVTKEKG